MSERPGPLLLAEIRERAGDTASYVGAEMTAHNDILALLAERDVLASRVAELETALRKTDKLAEYVALCQGGVPEGEAYRQVFHPDAGDKRG